MKFLCRAEVGHFFFWGGGGGSMFWNPSFFFFLSERISYEDPGVQAIYDLSYRYLIEIFQTCPTDLVNALYGTSDQTGLKHT